MDYVTEFAFETYIKAKIHDDRLVLKENDGMFHGLKMYNGMKKAPCGQ